MEFIKASFSCECCENVTDIYFEQSDGINEVFEKTKCRICKEIKLIGVGDLGYRTDLPEADYPPWQAQFIRIDFKDAVCTTCSDLNNIILDHTYLVTDCFICMNKNSMKTTKIINVCNEEISLLLTFISK